MRNRKLLAVASAADFKYRYGCTPHWWQLWRGLAHQGVEVIVTPYRGRPVESPWWRSYPNPCYRDAELYAAAVRLAARLKGDSYLRRAETSPSEGIADQVTRRLISRWVTPRWRRHLETILKRERDVEAVVVFGVPISHLRGIPDYLRTRFGVRTVFYDGDVPTSLPEYGGMDTGFNSYPGGDPSEYDLILSNSEGGLPRLRQLGARRAEVLFWGADPDVFFPLSMKTQHDVFFYGYGDKFRRDWIRALFGEPSRRAPDLDFALGGRDFRGDVGRARLLGDVPFHAYNRAIAAAHINVNITRSGPASVPASSTARPFELAMAGATIVSNPQAGIDRWFEPGRELIVVGSADEAVSAYRDLLGDRGAAAALGKRARERALDEHTFDNRARRLLDLIDVDAAAPKRPRSPASAPV
jgi:glycosyltransferase involved in cell wall biosynthesis